MKNILALLILVSSSTVFARVPAELAALVPVGTQSVRMQGLTEDRVSCAVDFANTSAGFSANLFVLENGHTSVRRYGQFQLGFGHELQTLTTQGSTLVAVATHEAEESYSSDSRATLKVLKNGRTITAVQTLNEAKGWFGYKVVAKETCILQK